jgi:hypothetical protein
MSREYPNPNPNITTTATNISRSLRALSCDVRVDVPKTELPLSQLSTVKLAIKHKISRVRSIVDVYSKPFYRKSLPQRSSGCFAYRSAPPRPSSRERGATGARGDGSDERCWASS